MNVIMTEYWRGKTKEEEKSKAPGGIQTHDLQWYASALTRWTRNV